MAELNDKQINLGRFLLSRLAGNDRAGNGWLGNYVDWRIGVSKFRLATPGHLLFAGIIGSVAGMGIIVVINVAATIEGQDRYSLQLPFIFLALVLLNKLLQSALLKSSTDAVEDALEEHRLDVARRITNLGLIELETLKRQDIQAGLTQHYEVINNSVIPLISGIRGVILTFLLVSYLAFISWIAAGISMVTAILCAYAYNGGVHSLFDAKARTIRAETDLLGNINDILDGFKELKLSNEKKNCLLEDLSESISRASMDRKLSTSALVDLIAFSNVVSYLLAGSIIFLLPIISDHTYGDISRIMALVLFLIGPITSVVDAAQQFTSVRFSLRQIEKFDKTLDQWSMPPERERDLLPFESLELADIRFARRGDSDGSGFIVGPINLKIKYGQITFIEGGNGSGKTTLIRLITGLYPADDGGFLLNGVPVSPDDYSSYSQYFGAIFADNHVIRKPYGLSSRQIDDLGEYLKVLEIKNCLPKNLKDDLRPDRLSTGQKKRLALALLLAEDRPIMIFDEWAADQDPHFRDIYYRSILPKLRDKGKCIIAITHDDRYFDSADQRFHMEDGKLHPVTPN